MLLVHCKKKSPKMKKKVREEEGSAVGALQVPELFTASETSPLIRSARSDADKIRYKI